MRTVSASAATEIAERFGTEPIILVEIVWDSVDGVESLSLYSDKEYGDYKGRIRQVGQIKNALRANNVRSFQLDLTLEDFDNQIKEHIDTHNIHKRVCRVYQAYGDATQSDKFLLFEGIISTPFSWNPTVKEITFSVTQDVESFEVGFSPEESQLDFVGDDAVGKPWPLAFGHVVHSPTVKVSQINQATLLEEISLPDYLLPNKKLNLEQKYQAALAQFQLHKTMASIANQLAPPVWWVLQQMVIVIIVEDIHQWLIFMVKGRLAIERQLAQKFPKNVARRNVIKQTVLNLKVAAQQAKAIKERKKWIRGLIGKIKFAAGVQKKSIGKALAAKEQMRQFALQIRKVELEICKQDARYKDTVKVLNAEEAGFPDGTPTDVCIKNVRFRVQFDHAAGTMELLTGPLPKYTGLEVDDWVPDDSGNNCIGGINMFWLKDEPPVNLEGMSLLVSGGTCGSHIIKVSNQIGRKVYFDLVEWKQNGSGGGGGGKGLSLDTVVNEIVEQPLVPGPQGNLAPADWFAGRLDPLIWNRAEAQLFLAIANMIPGRLAKDEKRDLAMLVFLLKLDGIIGINNSIGQPGDAEIYTITGEQVKGVRAAAGVVLADWFLPDGYCPPGEEVPTSVKWSAASGSTITDCTSTCSLYIVNLLPSTIKDVYAYRDTENDGRQFVPVPSSYYIKNESADLGTYTVTSLTFPVDLSEIPGEGWASDVYVSLESSVGQNTSDIIKWLLEKYTNVPVNALSFSQARSKLISYPANFTLMNRLDVLDEVARICWEARLGIILTGGEWHLIYLPEERDTDDTITKADYDRLDGVTVTYSSTDDLVTRMVTTFNETYDPEQEQTKVVLRHNVKQYGLMTREEHFHIYNDWKLVEKSATFWLLRLSHSYKKVKVKTFLNKIRTETFDIISLELVDDYVVTGGTVKCLVEEATYNPEDNSMVFTLHTGIKSGEMDQYEHFWSADSTTQFPTEIEIEKGYAGGHGPASGVVGTINDCPGES